MTATVAKPLNICARIAPQQLDAVVGQVGRERIMVTHGTEDSIISVPHDRKFLDHIQPERADTAEGMGHAPVMGRWLWSGKGSFRTAKVIGAVMPPVENGLSILYHIQFICCDVLRTCIPCCVYNDLFIFNSSAAKMHTAYRAVRP